MKKNEWKLVFKVKDKRLYGKKPSIISNLNIEFPTEMIPYVLQALSDEIRRLDRLDKETDAI